MDGNFYKGDFLNNMRHGKGTHTFSNGTQYKGYWKNDELDGYGVLKYAKGDVY